MKTTIGALRVACCALLLVTACDKCGDKAPGTGGPHGDSLGGMPLEGAPHGTAAPAAEPEAVFGERGVGVAFAAEANGKVVVVHDGRAGRPYDAVDEIALSPDGRRVAHGARVDGKWFMVVDGKEGAPFGVVGSPVFSPDGTHLAYVAKAGDSWHLVVDSTVSGPLPRQFLKPEFNAASSAIAFLDGADDAGWGRLVVSDLALKKQTVVAERATRPVVAPGRKRIAAVSASAGRRRVVVLDFDRPELARNEPDQDDVAQLTFSADGRSLAYLAERAGKTFVVLDGKEEPLATGEQPVTPPVVRPDGKGLGVFVLSGGTVALRQFFGEGARKEGSYGAAEALVYGPDGRSYAHAAQMGQKWRVVVNGKEGPPFDRVVSPVFSRDGRYLVYRARASGGRFVVVADKDGKTISLHRGYEQVYPVWFSADGKSIAYGVRDGGRFAWVSEAL